MIDGKYDNIFVLCEIQYVVIIFIIAITSTCKYFGTFFILCVSVSLMIRIIRDQLSKLGEGGLAYGYLEVALSRPWGTEKRDDFFAFYL